MTRLAVGAPVVRITADGACDGRDELAIEEPLEISLECVDAGVWRRRPLLIAMRTPGQDAALAAGFLWGEGVVRRADEIRSTASCGPIGGSHRGQNAVCVTLDPSVRIEWGRLERHVYASSSCGICGRATIDALESAARHGVCDDSFEIPFEILVALPGRMREHQPLFMSTGGMHAAALVSAEGEFIAVHEDVGRHNAVDKALGTQLLAGRDDLSTRMLLLSGRASFELVQKAIAARIGLVAAVGAPSSLAIELAHRFGVTLAGFVRDDRCTIYSTPGRVRA